MSSRPSTSRQSSHGSQASQSSQASSSQPQNAFYKAIVTPVIFVSFLLSLAWVEFRYSVLRSHSHESNSPGSSGEDCGHTWMPSWLHSLVYRRQDYQYVVVRKNETSKAGSEKKNERYYHTMQRKLLKMETDEAFRIRTTVLAVLAGGAAVAIWGAVAGARWLSWVLS